MNRIFLLTTLQLFIYIEGFPQIDLYAEVNTNYSIMNNAQKVVGIYTFDESYDHKFGFGFNAGISNKLSENIYYNVGIGIDNINYQKRIEIERASNSYPDYPQNPDPFPVTLPDNYDKIGTTAIYNLNLPIYVNYSVRKFSFGLGISPSILIYSKQIRGENGFYDPFKVTEKTNNEGLNDFSFSGFCRVEFQAIKNISALVQYTHGFTHIYNKDEQHAGNDKTKLIQLGLKYYYRKPNSNN
ncbi:outer membrane beta-barrel protein [Marinigracilibium pacificum]|uniref:Outer membrane beta-barrel protein n=1 Tax=Marinigracilibium pacificum TaxID=2729599 RepID=A0A848J2G3_9BACT|nr:outer membrane beta-barrel protein [Marinigracilibium pacificum]NMM50787.1 outer membrane beta-barrel protein [Marinigracilibium pacificum]